MMAAICSTSTDLGESRFSFRRRRIYDPFVHRKPLTMHRPQSCSGGCVSRKISTGVPATPKSNAGGKPNENGSACPEIARRRVSPEGKVWGRPVGITMAKDGSLLLSEDGNGTIWRVSYGR